MTGPIGASCSVNGPSLSRGRDTIIHVSDEPFYSPRHKPPPQAQPRPGESVWTLRKNSHRVDCALKFHGDSYGWECQCLYNGELAYGRRFVLRAQALEEGETHRTRLLGEGWS